MLYQNEVFAGELKESKKIHFLNCQFQISSEYGPSGIQTSMDIGQRKVEIVTETYVKMYQESSKKIRKLVHCFPLVILQKDNN